MCWLKQTVTSAFNAHRMHACIHHRCCCCCRFGESLETSEQEWLVWEINQKIAEVKGAAPTMEDMPPEDTPEVSGAAKTWYEDRV